MQIQLRTTIANAKMTAVSGSIIDVPGTEAAELIKGGFAIAVKETKSAPIAKKAEVPVVPITSDESDKKDIDDASDKPVEKASGNTAKKGK
jgi:hypothetical protein